MGYIAIIIQGLDNDMYLDVSSYTLLNIAIRSRCDDRVHGLISITFWPSLVLHTSTAPTAAVVVVDVDLDPAPPP